MDMVYKFSQRLNELIFDNNLNAKKLADETGCKISSIYEWLTGKMNYIPSVANLLKLADYFECSLDFLLDLEETNYPPSKKSRPPFSTWFRPAVESKGYNLYRLGKATKIGTQQFYKWINDGREPSIDSLIRIATVLDCTLDYLIGRES